jgi:hypothetical protein
LLLLDFPRISRLDGLMTACAILVIVVMTTSILVVMRSKIVLIRVTMVIVYLSGTPPGLSLSARFGPVSGVRGHSAHNYSTI